MVRELRNPYAALRRPVLLPTLPEEALVPDFACNLSATSGGGIGYTCFDDGVATQTGLMTRLR